MTGTDRRLVGERVAATERSLASVRDTALLAIEGGTGLVRRHVIDQFDMADSRR